MNPWIPCNSFSSLIAAVASVILAPTSGAVEPSLGVIFFSNSGSPAAQADFLTGLAQLHNFQYPQAAEAFQRAESLDPRFAMAYWGEAMTYNHAVWQQQDLAAARAALAKLGATAESRAAKAE